ncbi:hypothetical protein LCGC14_2008720, partial [marine sediment metagenome]
PLSDRLKIDVKSNGADVLTDQIRVQDPVAAAVFRVDGEGSMFVTAVFSDLIPKSAFSLDLGSVAERWNKAWLSALDVAGPVVIVGDVDIDGAVGITNSDLSVQGDILPTGSSRDLGSVASPWEAAFAKRIALGPPPSGFEFLQGTGTTFPISAGIRGTAWSLASVVGAATAGATFVAHETIISTQYSSGTADLLLGYDLKLNPGDSGGTVSEVVGYRVKPDSFGTGVVVTDYKGFEVKSFSGSPVVTNAYGLFIEDIVTGGGPVITNAFAIRTGLGLVQFGEDVAVLGSLLGTGGTLTIDDALVLTGVLTGGGTVEVGDPLHPDAAGVDIGGIAAADRWRNVFCEQVRASDVPIGVMTDATAGVTAFTENYVIVDFASTPVLRGGVTGGAGTDRFTVPSDGFYQVTYFIPIGDASGTPNAQTVCQGRCVVNGGGTPVVILFSDSQAAFNNEVRNALVSSFPVELVEGDTIEVQVKQRNVDGGVPSPAANFAEYPNRDDTETEVDPYFTITAISLTN